MLQWALVVLLAALAAACAQRDRGMATGIAGREGELGDPEAGRLAVVEFGCIGCHRIPGVPAADGEVGPSLRGFADRPMIAGVLPNTPDDLVRWLLDPPAVAPDTLMPDTGLDPRAARDVAAYLATLR